MKQKIRKFLEWSEPFVCLLFGIILFLIWMSASIFVFADLETVELFFNSIDPNAPTGVNWIFLLGMLMLEFYLPFQTISCLFVGVHLIKERYFTKSKELKGNTTETETE